MSDQKIQLFKPTGVEEYLSAAIQTADWIKNYQIEDENGKHWAISGTEGKVFDATEASFLNERGLYAGAAGIGFFYIQLFEATGEEKYLEEAKEAAKYLINTYKKELGDNPGIHAGTAGEGIFLENLYQKTGDESYRKQIVTIADDIYDRAIKEDGGIHWNSFFDYMGDGGAIAYWIYVTELTGDKKYLDYAKEGLDSILKLKIAGENDSIYFKLFDPHDYFSEVPAGGIIPNFAHGTAGVVYLLTKYYEATKDEEYLEFAKKGVKFLQSIAIDDEDASIVPYIYLEAEKKPYDVLYLGYCHGPVGDAITFKELYTATGDESYLEYYERLTKALVRAGVPDKRSAGYWNDCICCGSSGVLLHFTYGSKVSKNKEEYLNLAKRTAYKLVNDAYKDVNGRRWYNAWTRIKPWDVDSHLGLFVGTAGSASALLSLYGELTGKEISALFEYKKIKDIP